MEVKKIDYNKVKSLSPKDLAYIRLEPHLSNFYRYSPDIEHIQEAINDRAKYPINRNLLVKTLQEKYLGTETTKIQRNNINKLKEKNTFTITTAHQPSLLGGPLYFIYKICSTIHLCRALKNKYQDHLFVPVFVIGGEDHDFEEINHLKIYRNEIKWNIDAKGPVGRLPIKGLDEVLSKVKDILGDSDQVQKIFAVFEKALQKSETYGSFVFHWVNALFAKYGLLVLDMDDKRLKKEFSPIIKKEILEGFSRPIVEKTQNKLRQSGFKPQSHAREINFFYLGQGGRDRIEKEGNTYKIVGRKLTFTKEEMSQEIETHPYHFSPNVIMRPIYQEFTLPNLAYIGGGGEIAYWLERKEQFDAFNVFYPMLIRRNSALIISQSQVKKLESTGLTIEDIFEPIDFLIKKYIELNSKTDIDISNERKIIDATLDKLASRGRAIDPTLDKTIIAQKAHISKILDKIESRLTKAVKSKEEININKLLNLRNTLFPKNNLQERVDNFLPYGIKSEGELIQFLIKTLDPMDRRMTIITQ